MRYVVAHVITSPAGSVRDARLVISDVPDKTSVADVIKALTDAGRTGPDGFSEAGVPFGNHEVKPETRAGWPKNIAAIDDAPVVTWARLITPPRPNEGRRVTLRMPPAEYDAIALAAKRAGESLQAWAMSTLLDKAAADTRALGAAPAASRRRPAAADAATAEAR